MVLIFLVVLKLGTADNNNIAAKDSDVPILRTIRDAAREKLDEKRQGKRTRKKASGKKKMKKTNGKKKAKKDKARNRKLKDREGKKRRKEAKNSNKSKNNKGKGKRRKTLRGKKKDKGKRRENLRTKNKKKRNRKHKTRKEKEQKAKRRNKNKKKRTKSKKRQKSTRRRKLAEKLKKGKGVTATGRNSSSTGCPDLACINNAAAALKLEKDQIANFIKQKSRVENYMKTVTGKLSKKGQFEADAASLKSALGGDLENATCGGSTQRTVSAAAEVI